MSAIDDAVAEAGRRLSLTAGPGGKVHYGEVDGRLVHLASNAREPSAVVRVRVDDVADPALLFASVAASQSITDAAMSKRKLTLTPGYLTYVQGKPSFRALLPETIEASVRALVAATSSSAGRRPQGCRLCKGAGSQLLLVGDDVDHLCNGCVQKLEFEVENARRVYESIPLNLAMAFLVGLVCAVVGAGVWAGMTIATGSMFWLVAVAVGALIGWGTVRGAGRGGLPVQVLGFVLTLVAMLIGELLFIAHLVNEEAEAEGGSVDWAAFVGNAPDVLVAAGTDTLFTLGAGVLGAFTAIGAGSKREFARVHRGSGTTPGAP